MFIVGCRKMGDSMVAQSQCETGVNDVSESGGFVGGPSPQRFANLGFIIAVFPMRVGLQCLTKKGCLSSRFRLFKDRWITKLHVDFHQYKTA